MYQQQQPMAWSIPQTTIAKYSQMFNSIDQGRSGFITGAQARGVLMQSGLAQDTLAKIWSLSDGTVSGRLTVEEFILAMYLIEMTRAGHAIPHQLPPDLIPPSYRRRPSGPGVPPMTNVPMTNVPAAGVRPPGAVAQVAPPQAFVPPTAVAMVPPGPVPVASTVPTMASTAMPPTQMPPTQMAPTQMASTAMAWSIPAPSQAKYGQLFHSIDVNKTGFVTGAQARGVLMQSGLAQDTLAKIWSLSDGTVSGRLTVEEFILAMHLVDMAKASSPLPVTLPPDMVPPSYRTKESPAVSAGSQPARGSSSEEPIPPSMMLTEWAIPQSSKLKYNQLFNQHDRSRSGYLTGIQARGILVHSGLNQNILAKIWGLCDVTLSGKLTSEEFVLAMHLIDLAKSGQPLPNTLPLDLVPPIHRRRRNSSLSSNPSTPLDSSDLSPASFEDKRKANFDKGQAVLDRKRQELLDQQRREQEDRERKEREEQAKREKVRLEMERKRQEEIERQMQKQREIEAEKEEKRKQQLEKQEAARREMERQRMKEWESARMGELSVQKERVLEMIGGLKSKKKTLVIEGERVTSEYERAKGGLAEVRNKVANGKSVIDGMRSERDNKMKEMNQLNSALKLLAEKEKYVKDENDRIHSELKRIANLTDDTNPGSDLSKLALQNKEIIINQLKSQMSLVQSEKESKIKDIDRNGSVLGELRENLDKMKERIMHLQTSYTNTVTQGSQLKEILYQKSLDPSSAWDEPPPTEDVVSSVDLTHTDLTHTDLTHTDLDEKQVLYQFDARNEDELNLIPGDTVWIIPDPSAEEGWLKGRSADGKVGWFPEAYVGPPGSAADVTLEPASESAAEPTPATEPEATPAATPAATSAVGETQSAAIPSSPSPAGERQGAVGREEVIAEYSWLGKEGSHLSMNRNELITVTEKEGEWLFGEIGNRKGWFPANHSRLIDEVSQSDNYYITLYPFEAQESGDLGFDANYLVHVIKKDGDWWTGTIVHSGTSNTGTTVHSDTSNTGTIVHSGTSNTGTSRTGVFPSNYVRQATEDEIPKPAEPTTPTPKSSSKGLERRGSDRSRRSRSSSISSSEGGGRKKGKGGKKPEVVMVIAPYKATGPEQLNLEKGQLIQVRKKNQSGWWEGESQQKGKKKEVGWFPATYVKPLTGGPAATSGPSSARSTPDTKPSTSSATDEASSVEKVISIYPFTAQHDDELSFDANEVIKIVSKDDPTWWKGQLIKNGAIGLFPSNHVQEYKYSVSETDTHQQNGHQQKEEESPSTFLSDNQESKMKQRIKELIATEEDYQRDLELVSVIFKDQLFSTRAISSSERDVLFSNWDTLRDENKRFLRRIKKSIKGMSDTTLEKSLSEGLKVLLGKSLSEGLKVLEPQYIHYCSRLGRAESLIELKSKDNGYFSDQLKRFSSDPRLTGLSLLSYLLKPMQRVTKYPLLIKEIIKADGEGNQGTTFKSISSQAEFTDSIPKYSDSISKYSDSIPKYSDSISKYSDIIPNYIDGIHDPDLLHALSVSEGLCSRVNEGRRSFENEERLEWIQSHVILSDGLEITFNSDTAVVGKRELLHLGSLIKANSGKELMVFLFSDFLLLTIPSKDIGKVSNLFASEKAKAIMYKMYKRPYFLDEIELLPHGVMQGSSGSGSVKGVSASGSVKGVSASNSRSSSPSILRSSPSMDTFDPTFFALSLKPSIGTVSNNSKKVIPFKAISVNDKAFWIKNLTRALSSYSESINRQSSTTGPKISVPINRRFSLISNVTGRLLVSIVEGINLQSIKSGQITAFVVTSLGSPSMDQLDHLQVEQSDIVKSIASNSSSGNHDLLALTSHSPLNFPPSPTEPSQMYCTNFKYCKNFKFSHSMRFLFSDECDDHALVVSVFEKDPFSPDRLMGRAMVPLTTIRHELSMMSVRPLTKHVTLMDANSISSHSRKGANVATSQQASILLKLDIIPNN